MPDVPANSSTSATVTVGGYTTETIEVVTDIDWFRVTLVGGTTYRVDITGSDSSHGTLSDPYLEGIYNSIGTLLFGPDDDSGTGWDAQLMFTAPSSGTYYIGASSYLDTGTYRVAISTADIPGNTSTTATLSVGGSASSTIDTAGDQDWFSITLTAGQQVQFDLEGSPTSQGTLPDPKIMGIYNSSGTLLANTTDDDGGTSVNALVTFTAPSSGTYYVAAGAYGSYTGTYKLSATAVGGGGGTGEVWITAASANKAEGNSGTTAFTFTVTRDGSTAGSASVQWAVTGTGAHPAAAADFTGGVLPSGTVTFNAGETTKTVTVNVLGETSAEYDELFTVTLSNPVGVTLGTGSVSTTLTDSASGGDEVLERSYLLAGGTGTFTLNYEMYSMPDQAEIFVNGVQRATTGGMVSGAGTLTVADNLLNAGDTVMVRMTGGDPGTAWDFTVNYAGGAQTIDYLANGTIVNDDGTPPVGGQVWIDAADASKDEGDSGPTPFTFTVTRDGDTSVTGSVQWAVTGTGGNPANIADFTGGVFPSGTVTFNAGETTKTVTVNVNGDTTAENDETFTVTLSNPVNLTLKTGSVSNTINDSASGGDEVLERSYLLAAGTGSFSLSYQMYSMPDQAEIFVNGVLSATTGGMVSGSGTLTVNDSLLDAGDTVLVRMTGGDPGTAWDFTASYSGGLQTIDYLAGGTIVNDDVPKIWIEADDTSKNEGHSGTTAFTFTVTRTGSTAGSASAQWAVTGTGAHAATAADFVGGALPSGTITFAAGESSKTITINVLGEVKLEHHEGFTVTLSNPVGAVLGTGSVSTTLSDSASGGDEILERSYLLAGGTGDFVLNYEMYSMPDQAEIFVNGVLRATTGGMVSGSDTLTIADALLSAGDTVLVRMTGGDPGTAWDFDVTYSGGAQTIGYLASSTIVNDELITIVYDDGDSNDNYGLYKVSNGQVIIDEHGLDVGDSPDDPLVLMVGTKNYAPKVAPLALLEYNDGSFGVVAGSGTKWTEQLFTSGGAANGSALKHTFAKVLHKEAVFNEDINQDGIIGDTVAQVFDNGSGDTRGLYKTTLAGAYVIGGTFLDPGDSTGNPILLMSGTKLFAPKLAPTSLIEYGDGSFGVIVGAGTKWTEQAFDSTGLALGKAVKLTMAQLWDREDSFNEDLNNDGQIGDPASFALMGIAPVVLDQLF